MSDSKRITSWIFKNTAWMAVVLAASAWTQAAEGDDPSGINTVKSALVLNFTRYSSWPEKTWDAGGDASLDVGVLGDGDVVDALRSLEGRRSGHRTLRVFHITDPADAAGMHVIFMSESGKDSWPSVRDVVAGRPVLTIGESSDFTESGGLIGLLMENGRFRFEVNLAEARAVDLRISSKLLKLAKAVQE